MKSKRIIKDMAICAMFEALLIVSTFIRIPMPFDDYLTLQLEVVILLSFILGVKRSIIVLALYLFMGLIGLPVFAAGGGITYIFKASFGYIYGFLFAGFTVSLLVTKIKNINIAKSILISLLGVLIIYICGYLHKYVIYNFYLENQALALNEIILATMAFELPKDLILGVLIGIIGLKLRKIYLKMTS